MSLSINDAQIFSAALKRARKKKTSDPGAMCGAARPFRVLPEGPGTLPLFPKHWKFLPHLQDAGYIRRWLYLPGQPWQDRLYIPGAVKAAHALWRKEPVRPGGHGRRPDRRQSPCCPFRSGSQTDVVWRKKEKPAGQTGICAAGFSMSCPMKTMFPYLLVAVP